MTPLTISLLQLISNLSGIGISTIPDHCGPHQSPKTATHTPKNHDFPRASLFSWLISGTPPQIWPHQPNLCLNLAQIYLELAYLPFPTIGGPSEPQNGQKNTIFPSIFVFVNNITYFTPKMTPFTISLLLPTLNLSGIGISIIPDHRGPHQSPKMATNTPKKHLFP